MERERGDDGKRKLQPMSDQATFTTVTIAVESQKTEKENDQTTNNSKEAVIPFRNP